MESNEKEINVTSEGETLSSLSIANDEYNKLIPLFNQKQKTTAAFMSRDEFIKAEIERVKSEANQSMKVTSNDGNITMIMDYSAYRGYAYKWLKAGDDWPICRIVDNARKDLENRRISHFVDESVLYNNIIGNLKIGVANLMYEKFLNEQLKSTEEKLNGAEPIIFLDSAEDVVRFLNNNERKNYEEFIEGFMKMEAYIHKNVHEQVNLPLQRLKQLNRNLTNWSAQLKSVFIEPIEEREVYSLNRDFNLRINEAIEKMDRKILNALEVIRLRIKDSEESPRESDSVENVAYESDIEARLNFLRNRNPKNNLQIIDDKSFKRLIGYTEFFFSCGKVPSPIEQIRKLNMVSSDITYTFRELYRDLKPEKNGRVPFELYFFLHSVFSQLNNPKEITVDNYRNTTLYKKGSKPTDQYKALLN